MLSSEFMRVLMFVLARGPAAMGQAPLSVDLVEPTFAFPAFPAAFAGVGLYVWLATPRPFARDVVRWGIRILDADGHRVDGGAFVEGSYEIPSPRDDYRVGEYDHQRFIAGLEGFRVLSPAPIFFLLEVEGRELATLPVSISQVRR